VPLTPAIVATARIMADDINGNNTTKQFNSVSAMNLDFAKGQINIVDVTGSFYFSLGDITSLTYTVAGGVDFGAVTIVMS
jgi:hypothetical protein